MIRIETGLCKGLKLQVADDHTRPTLAKVRGAIMNSLQIQLADDPVVLDLFAGTGVMGIEAVSRGASQAVFVESSKLVRKLLDANIELCRKRCESNGHDVTLKSISGDVKDLAKLLTGELHFDLIFSDPPYADTALYVERLSSELKKISQPNGIWVLEHERRGLSAEILQQVEAKGWTAMKAKTFGDVVVQFWRNNGETQ